MWDMIHGSGRQIRDQTHPRIQFINRHRSVKQPLLQFRGNRACTSVQGLSTSPTLGPPRKVPSHNEQMGLRMPARSWPTRKRTVWSIPPKRKGFLFDHHCLVFLIPLLRDLFLQFGHSALVRLAQLLDQKHFARKVGQGTSVQLAKLMERKTSFQQINLPSLGRSIFEMARKDNPHSWRLQVVANDRLVTTSHHGRL